MEAAGLRIEPGEFFWHEYVTSDLDAAELFYTQTLGWELLEAADEEDTKSYLTWYADGIPIAGMMWTDGDEPFEALMGGQGLGITDNVATLICRCGRSVNKYIQQCEDRRHRDDHRDAPPHDFDL